MSEGLPILSVSQLSKRFSVSGNTVQALHGINLDIHKGEFVCLIGASGCGKSTLLRILAGFEQASAGTASMYGSPIEGPGPERGMVFQDFALFPWLTVKQNIAFGPHQRNLPQAKLDEISTHYMDMVGLSKFADYFPSQLSGGMKQRVAIARVLSNDCEVLLMDEPFGALDALTREKLQPDLLEIWDRTHLTVVFVTHAVEEAVLLSDLLAPCLFSFTAATGKCGLKRVSAFWRTLFWHMAFMSRWWATPWPRKLRSARLSGRSAQPFSGCRATQKPGQQTPQKSWFPVGLQEVT